MKIQELAFERQNHREPPDVINPCGKEWNAGDLAYRCRDSKIEQFERIAPCFKEAYVGHDFTIYRSEAGGVCDCGDYESGEFGVVLGTVGRRVRMMRRRR